MKNVDLMEQINVIPSRCNIGFASNAINTANISGQQSIKDGTKLIPGNVLMYLVNVSKQNPVLADKIKTEYTIVD